MAYLDPSPGQRVASLWRHAAFAWISGITAGSAVGMLAFGLRFGTFGPGGLVVGWLLYAAAGLAVTLPVFLLACVLAMIVPGHIYRRPTIAAGVMTTLGGVLVLLAVSHWLTIAAVLAGSVTALVSFRPVEPARLT